MKTTYNYVGMHIPTGQASNRTVDTMTRLEFLEFLNTWNRSNPGVWVYYEGYI